MAQAEDPNFSRRKNKDEVKRYAHVARQVTHRAQVRIPSYAK